MAFTVSDAQDLVRLLRDHPEWRDDVRREILGPDYLPLPQLVRENAEAIRDLTVVADRNSVDIAALGVLVDKNSADIAAMGVLVDKNREDIARLGVLVDKNREDIARLGALVDKNSADIARLGVLVDKNSADIAALGLLVDKNREDIAALTADVRAMQADMVEFRVRMDEFNMRMDAFSVRMDEFSVRMDAHQSHIEEMLGKLPRMEADLAMLKGFHLEFWHRQHPGVLATGRLRRVRVVDPQDVLADAYDAGEISDEEWDAVVPLDLLLAGREGRGAEAHDAMLAVEVSWTIDEHDVERARQRAEIIARTGVTVRPLVVGKQASPAILAYAREQGVGIVTDDQPESIAS